MERYGSYIGFMVCIFVTLIVILTIAMVVRLVWEYLVEPIMDRIKKQLDNEYWDKFQKARSERDELEAKLHRIGLGDDFVSCLDGYYGPNNSGEYKDEHTPEGYIHVMVKFTLNERKFNKIKEEREKIFRGEKC